MLIEWSLIYSLVLNPHKDYTVWVKSAYVFILVRFIKCNRNIIKCYYNYKMDKIVLFNIIIIDNNNSYKHLGKLGTTGA